MRVKSNNGGPPCCERHSLTFGGKFAIAPAIWERLGDVAVYAEPFFGSGAVLLGRPSTPRIETVNDLDGSLANVWRAIRHDPDQVAYWASDIVSECDLHSRHAWLLSQRAGLSDRLMADPDYYDAKAAGWWVWGASCWIGSGWCSGRGPWSVVDGRLVKADAAGIERKRPHLMHAGRGVHAVGVWRKIPHLSRSAGIHQKLPHLGHAGTGIQVAGEGIRAWLGALADRLRRVRICCGEWDRILGPSGTVGIGITGVMLDPPYPHADRDSDLYHHDQDVWAETRAWAIEHGSDLRYRIALCGYAGAEMPDTWSRHAWKSQGGYGNQGTGRGKDNAAREMIWFSPFCEQAQQPSLFDQDIEVAR